MNIRSISFRLVTWYAGLLAGIFLMLCAVWYLDLRHFLENCKRRLKSAAGVMSVTGRFKSAASSLTMKHVSQYERLD